VSRKLKYTNVADWQAVADLGHTDPGPRPLDDVAKKPLDAEPVVALPHTGTSGFGGLYDDGQRQRESERRRAADAALEKAGLREPRSW
jgi:hypothetical protein